jgi:ribonucleoside-diphosphate reductase beta chain
MGITTIRANYKPFEYEKAYEYYRKEQLVHWIKDEIKLAEDLINWSRDLTQTERDVVGGILKGFTQMEILVGDYWRKVPDWFPKPEIAMMCSTFSYFESIHMDNYHMINEELGLEQFEAFLYDENTKHKLDYFIDFKVSNIENDSDDIKKKALSLAIFSAFAEGCMLFSSFAVLLSFQKENLLKGIGQIVSFSIRDENIHSEAGCWLFNQLCNEYTDIRSSIWYEVTEAAKMVYQLECAFIDNLFKNGNIRTLNANDLKNFIAHRINMKLNELGYSNINTIDNESIKRMQWFDMLNSGREFGDFFATRVTEYTKVNYSSKDLF